jgi:magnesium-transporting ATPase (P-type)
MTGEEHVSVAIDSDNLEKAPLETIYRQLETTPEGLTADEATLRLNRYGRNALEEKHTSALQKLLVFFWGPIPWMIEIAALLSAMIGHWTDFGIIMTLLIYNAVSGFWQERKAADALEVLKAGMAPQVPEDQSGGLHRAVAVGGLHGSLRRCAIRMLYEPLEHHLSTIAQSVPRCSHDRL